MNFDALYARSETTYGLQPSEALACYLRQVKPSGQAVDLGAGLGRNTLEMAAAGMHVHAIDHSAVGLSRLRELAERRGLIQHITTAQGDLSASQFPYDDVALVVAVTVLDHLPDPAAKRLWKQMVDSLAKNGAIYAEVHTTADPGSPAPPGCFSTAPVSETAFAVKKYFAPGELLSWLIESGGLRVLHYEERLEWDYTHGPTHLHGKAVLLATRTGHYPLWYGCPERFPPR